MSRKFAVYQNVFAYDNWIMSQWVLSSSVYQIFDTEEQALTCCKNLIVESLRLNWDNFDVASGESTDYIYKRLDELFIKKIYISKFPSYRDGDPLDLNQLTDEEVFKLAHAAGITEYVVNEIECSEKTSNDKDDTIFYVIWLNYHNTYFKDYKDEIIYSAVEDYFSRDEGTIDYLLDLLNEKPPIGELHVLTNKQEQLKELLLNQWAVVKYCDNHLAVEKDYGGFLYSDSFDYLKSVNTLLKKPWFEIRALSYNELVTLETS